MFFAGSRYQKLGTYQVTRPDGTTAVVTRLPLPPRPPEPRLLGWHPRREGQRLDHIAHHYLADATAFWRLADASNAVVPDTLAARDRIAIPAPTTPKASQAGRA